MPVPIPSRPQTLREAKKAYRKSSGIIVSDIEKRRLKRASELEKRAEQIKAKEKQRRINRQKKEEKERKDKEAKKRIGIGEGRDANTEPGQAIIASFLDRLPAKAVDHEEPNIPNSKNHLEAIIENKQSARPPLQEIDSNKNRCGVREVDTKSPMKKPSAMVFEDDDWAGLLASSTQIEREISHSSQAKSISPQGPVPAPPVAKNLDVGVDCDHGRSTAEDPNLTGKGLNPSELPLISTQDLEFTAEDLQELESPMPKLEIPGFFTQDFQITDEDLLDLDPSRLAERPLPTPGLSVPTKFVQPMKQISSSNLRKVMEPDTASFLISALYDWSSDDSF